MRRRTFDILVSAGGLFLAVVLIVAGVLLTWAHNFVSHEVHTQLSAQKIFFPPKGSEAIAGPEYTAMQKYAGQQMTNGDQAQTYADHFIAVHLQKIGGGKTYAQLSSEALANPTDTKLAATVESMFRGETLRGLLMGTAIVSYLPAAALAERGIVLGEGGDDEGLWADAAIGRRGAGVRDARGGNSRQLHG